MILLPPPPRYASFITLSCCDSTAGRHHKAADTLADRNVITRLFYGCYAFFAYCCVGTELFYVALYLLVFIPDANFSVGMAGGATITLHAVSLGDLIILGLVFVSFPFVSFLCFGVWCGVVFCGVVCLVILSCFLLFRSGLCFFFCFLSLALALSFPLPLPLPRARETAATQAFS